jgi:hypothetical protein
MQCARCQQPCDDERRWCAECERDYDIWSRRHAADIVWQALGGMVVVMSLGVLLPALGVPMLIALSGVFAGFGTIVGLNRLNRRRRRGQFLRGAAMPRAYLPTDH